MPQVYLAPSFGAGYQGFSAGGLPLNTGTITTYLAGGTTPKETYTTSAGSVQCANPIVLGIDGRPSTEIWLVSGFAYRFDLKDSLGNLIKTYDNLSGIGDPLIAASVFGASLMAGASATVDRGLLGLADATAKGDTLSAAAAGAFTRKAVGSNGSVVVADSSQTDGLLWLAQYPNSFAPNAFFQVNQLSLTGSATSTSDDTYGHDHWYVLSQTASVQVSTQTLQENGQATNARLTQNQAAAQRFGYACIIEASEAQKLRGSQMSFKPRVRISNSQVLECAVLEWTGTADTVTSDVVLDWTNGTYTAGQFFLAANLNVLGVTAITPSAATWTDATLNTVTVGSSCNNLILFVWTAAVASQNVTLDIGKVRFARGSYAGEFYMPTYAETLQYAKRFYDARAYGYLNGDTGYALGGGNILSTSTGMFIVDTPAHRISKIPTIDVSEVGDFKLIQGTTSSFVTVFTVNNTSVGFGAIEVLVTGTATPYTIGSGCLLKVDDNGVNAHPFFAFNSRL